MGMAARAAQGEDNEVVCPSHLKTCTEAEEFQFLNATMDSFGAVQPAPQKRPFSGQGGSSSSKRRTIVSDATAANATVQAAAWLPSVELAGTEVLDASTYRSLQGCDDDYDA